MINCGLFSLVCFATPPVPRSCAYLDSFGKFDFRASKWGPFTTPSLRSTFYRVALANKATAAFARQPASATEHAERARRMEMMVVHRRQVNTLLDERRILQEENDLARERDSERFERCALKLRETQVSWSWGVLLLYSMSINNWLACASVLCTGCHKNYLPLRWCKRPSKRWHSRTRKRSSTVWRCDETVKSSMQR